MRFIPLHQLNNKLSSPILLTSTDRVPPITVLLTRPLQQIDKADDLHRHLRAADLNVVDIPTVSLSLPEKLEHLRDALTLLSEGYFTAAIISSPAGAHFLFEVAKKLRLLTVLRERGTFAAVGNATRITLEQFGFRVNLPVPQSGGSQGLAELFREQYLAQARLLLLQSQLGLPTLQAELVGVVRSVHRETLYRTSSPSAADVNKLQQLMLNQVPDIVAFCSPSAVHGYVEALHSSEIKTAMAQPSFASIGNTTSGAIETLFHRAPEIQSMLPSQSELAAAIIAHIRK